MSLSMEERWALALFEGGAGILRVGEALGISVEVLKDDVVRRVHEAAERLGDTWDGEALLHAVSNRDAAEIKHWAAVAGDGWAERPGLGVLAAELLGAGSPQAAPEAPEATTPPPAPPRPAESPEKGRKPPIPKETAERLRAKALRSRLMDGVSNGNFNPMDVLELYELERGRLVKLDSGEFYQFDQSAHAYRARSREQFLDALVAWMLADGSPFRNGNVGKLDRWCKSIVTAARTRACPGATVPFFRSSGLSGEGWLVFRNGRLSVREAAKRLDAGEPLPSVPEPGSPVFQPNDDDLVSTTPALPCNWNPSAECPECLKWLEEVLPEAESRLMAMFEGGYLLSEDVELKTLFVAAGPPDTAKSAWARLLTAVLPFPVAWVKSWSSLEDKFAMSDFVDCGLVVFDDCAGVPTRKQWEVLKGYVSGKELVPYRRMYRDTVYLPVRARVLICTNNRSKFPHDDAMAVRERDVFFPVQFGHGDRPKNDGIELRIAERERAGILAWLVRGYAELLGAVRANNGNFPNLGFGATMKETAAEVDLLHSFLVRNLRMTTRKDSFILLPEIRERFRVECWKRGLLDDDGDPIPDEDGNVEDPIPSPQAFRAKVQDVFGQARYCPRRTCRLPDGEKTSGNFFQFLEWVPTPEDSNA